MFKPLIRRPTQKDVEHIIKNIRPEDEVEVNALDGSTVRQCLEETPGLFQNSYVWEVDGKPVCIFGVTRQDGPLSSGVVWLLAAKDFHKYTRKFARACRDVFNEVIKGYAYLYNYIHAENKVSIQWLKSLGFDILDPTPIGHKGASFHKFEMKNV